MPKNFNVDHSKQAVEVFDKNAGLYQLKFMQVTAYETALNKFLEQINTNASILDIACGPGNISRYLLNKKPYLQITGIDLSPAMLELAKVNCPGASFQLMDSRQIGELQQKFDGIVSGFCLPYLDKAEGTTMIKDSARLLLPGGYFYLSTMLGEYRLSEFKTGSTGDRVFTHYYSEDDIEDMLQQAGLRPVLKEIITPPQGVAADTDIVIVAAKG